MKVVIREGAPEPEIVINCTAATDEIRRMAALLLGYDKKLTCVKDGATHLINKRDILYMESVDKRSFIYTAGDVFETPLKLYQAEELYSEDGFVRVAKALVINIEKIESLCPDFGGRIEAVMENGEKLVISRQYSKQFKERLGLK